MLLLLFLITFATIKANGGVDVGICRNKKVSAKMNDFQTSEVSVEGAE